MKIAALAALVGSAAAFSPASTGKASTALNAFESELGVQDPLGFYDPLGLLDDADQERFERLRYVELKHGRISMLAFLGQITTRSGSHLSGNIDMAGDSFDSYPNGIAAFFGPDAIPQAGFFQIFAFVGLLELGVMLDVPGADNEFVGDFRNGAIDFGWDTFDEETKFAKRAIELNNGRAAMLGIIAFVSEAKIPGSVPLLKGLIQPYDGEIMAPLTKSILPHLPQFS